MITYGFVFRNYIQNRGGIYRGRPVAEVRNNKQEADNKNKGSRITSRTRIKNKLLRKERRQECGIDGGVFYRTIRLRIPDAKGWPYR